MRTTSLAAVLLLCISTPAQRECMATHDDGTLLSGTSTGGLPLGYRLTAAQQMDVVAIQVHTGLRDGPASVAIYDHDAVNNAPGTVLSTGSYTQRRVTSWQGAQIPQVTIQSGQVFWVVWTAPNSSAINWSTNPAGTIYYRGFSNNAWNGPASGWGPKPVKIRLYCNHAATAPIQYGTAQVGSGGIAPTLQLEGYAVIGNALEFVLQNAAPSSLAALGIGVTQISQNLPGLGTLLTQPLAIVFVPTTAGRTPGTGEATFALRTPATPAVIGLYASQYWVFDAGAATGVSHTDGLAFVLSP